MIKLNKAASAAAFALFSTSFLIAYGATTSASAQTSAKSFEAPVIVAPNLAAPVELSNTPDTDDNTPASVDSPDTLAELVSAWGDNQDMDSETRCLAVAVFYEARSESLAGQLAVANVVIQRARSGRFPGSLCGVVTQAGQFGFVRKGRLPSLPEGNAQTRTAEAIAEIALAERWRNPAPAALYFHASHSSPGWGHEMVTQIGRHVFYR